ncbi:MAG: tetratricopeptide repeat protein [Acidobacteriia bacterium]|nr:tetratricopeptide repeat protein [Terriglobia bacterium]
MIGGYVRGPDGRALSSGVTMTLETEDGEMVQSQLASRDGQFEFGGLRKMRYRLSATAEGFQPAQEFLDLRTPSARALVNFFLTPMSGMKSEKGLAPSLTDQQAPKKAREEYSIGMGAFAKGEYASARGHLEKAITDYPCFARAHTQLALTLIGMGSSSQAEAPLRKSIECDPGYYEAHLVLGQLFNQEKKFEESEKILTEGLRLSPASWQFYYQLGVAHFGLRQYDKADLDYQKALSFNPTPPPEDHVKVADVYLAQEAYDKAYAQMQAYLQAEPSGRFAEKIRKIIREMEAAGVLDRSRPQ